MSGHDPEDDDVAAAWIKVCEDPHAHSHLYELAEKLVDLDVYFRRWRFKRGTGGTSGVKYLRRMLEVELFPELWNIRGAL